MGKLKTVVKFFGVLILIGLLLIGVLLLILERNKPYFISKAESWYSENHTGELNIKDFDFQIIRSFPNLDIQFNQVTVRDSSFSGRNHRRLSVGTINFSCSSRKLLKKQLTSSRIELKDVNLSILVDTLDHSSKEKESTKDGSAPDLEKWLSPQGADFIFQNAQISIINRPKKKRYIGTINEVSGNFKPKGYILSGPVLLDVNMDEMGLNVEKGTFFNTAHLRGNLTPKIDLRKKEFFAPPFELKIDEQDFLVSTHINLGTENFFNFELINEATDYQASKHLISQNIQEKIELYELTEPFYTKTNIQGKFKDEGNPLITLDFKVKNNQAVLNKIHFFDSLSFTGHLANRAIGDETLTSKNRKDFHLIFSEASGYFEGVPFFLKDSYVESTPKTKNLIQLNLLAEGETERLNHILKNDAFFFKSGRFNLSSYFKGNVKNPLDILNYSTNEFRVHQTNVYYSKADLTVPVRKIQFDTKNGNAILKSLRLTFPNNQNLEVTGNLNNYASLLFDELKNPIKSFLKIESRDLDYDGLFATIQAATKQSNQQRIEREEIGLRAIFENIYHRFNPKLSINIDKFSYKDVLVEDFKTVINYQDKNTLTLSNSNFKFGEGTIQMDGNVHLPEGNNTLANLGIKADGAMASLNELFDNKAFILQAGRFALSADYQGSLDHPSNLLTGSEVALRLADTKIYHADQDLIIPIDSALITLEKRDAEIAALSIPFTGGNHVSITGKVTNFTSLLKDEPEYEVNSKVKISSQKLSSKNFNRINEIFFDSKRQGNKSSDKNALHRGIATVHQKFQPALEVQIDTFKSQDYLLENLHSKVYYKNATTLVVENTGFELDKGRLDLDAIFNFSENEKINTDLNISANGEARRFDKLFKNNTFFFKEGTFDFKLGFVGDLLHKKTILEHLDSRLTLQDSRVFYKDMNLTIPLDDVDLILKNKNAIIKDFAIPLTSGHRIKVTGKVENFNTLLLDSIPIGVVSDLNIYSKELDFRDLSRMFDVITEADSLSEHKVVPTPEMTNVFKATVQGIYNKFLPTINVVIDDFWYKTFNAKNIKTGLQFQDKNHLELQKTEFELGNAHVLLDAELDLTELERTGFNTDFTAENIELKELIQAFDFFGLPSLKSAGSVSGILSVDSHLNGHIIDHKGSIDTTLLGTVAFDLESLRLQNFEPILSTAGKILRDKRIDDIHFAPLIDTLKIENSTVQIPVLNVTSTAFTLYMKGDLRYDNKSNLLISVPWSNLWFWNEKAIPVPKQYGESGGKFHIHALGNDKNTMDYKFRFSGRKWYKAQGILPLYRKEKRQFRRERRKYKRAMRARKRNAKRNLPD